MLVTHVMNNVSGQGKIEIISFQHNHFCSDYEKFCNGVCISKSIPCMGTCENTASSFQNNFPMFSNVPQIHYPVLCEEENLCKSEWDPCGGKCLNASLPIIAFSGSLSSITQVCIKEIYCIPDGPIFGSAHYMCNGICIPVFIPCNHTCLDNVLWRTNRREELFGPIQCKEIEDNEQTENILLLKSFINFEGFCLPGSMQCNGTCSIDPRRPLKSNRFMSDVRRGEDCVEACHRTREWPCNGTCIEKYKPCGDTCSSNHFRCKSGKCINNYQVCGTWNDCEDGEDEENCPANCGPSSIVINGNGTKICKADKKTVKKDSCEGKFLCDNGTVCVNLYKINDGEVDCDDGSDENMIIGKISKAEGDHYENTEEMNNSDFLWICDGKVQHITQPCHGECNFVKWWILCLGENGTGVCVPYPNEVGASVHLCPNETGNSLISSSGKECRFMHR